MSALDVLVIGAGVMGAGIAQVAAQSGHRCWLHDARPGAAEEARARLLQTWQRLVEKGTLTTAQVQAAAERLQVTAQLSDAAHCGLVTEAIVERLDAKRALLTELEALLSPEAILASNTSSISITALARDLRHPGRVVGLHFFNPVPLMQLVEVVSGLRTDPAVAERLMALARDWGKTPVAARSTPGFIVNRIARPYYAEALMLLQERAARPETLDAALRGAGFRMGPCELMDLIGHDTNLAVTRSVFDANFGDRRFAPSPVQQDLVDGGLLGRKSGQGFYRYPEGPPAWPVPEATARPRPEGVVVHGSEAFFGRVARRPDAGPLRHVQGSGWTGLQIGSSQLRETDGRCAYELAGEQGGIDVAVFDRSRPEGPLAYAVAGRSGWRDEAGQWLRWLGHAPLPVADTPGLVVARTQAMLINEAADAVLQGVCTAGDADAAMKLGVNYPGGPFEWLAAWSAPAVVALIERLDAHYRGDRYRVSPFLRRGGAA